MVHDGELTREDALKEFVEEFDKHSDNLPVGHLQEEPRFQLTGEIIPPSLRGDRKKNEMIENERHVMSSRAE